MRNLVAVAVSAALLSPLAAQAVDSVDVGGAARLNYSWNDANDKLAKDDDGAVNFDIFRLNVNATSGKWTLDAEYRWWDYQDAIHHMYAAYALDDETSVKVGIQSVPFGLGAYHSMDFWFGVGFYLGFEDDYDTGIVVEQNMGNWTFQSGYFANAEYASGSTSDRYSTDIAVDDSDHNNEEDGQLNFRAVYDLEGIGEIGASAQWGRIYNYDTDEHGDMYAVAAHWNGAIGQWLPQLQYYYYEYDQELPTGVDDDVIAANGYSATWLMPAKASVVTANLGYNFNLGADSSLDSLTCYNDFSMVAPDGDDMDEAYINTTGCSFGKGGLFGYVDWIAGYNSLFLGESNMGTKADADWNNRLNINVGYYF